MSDPQAAASVDEYIAAFPAETRATLEEIRSIIRAAAPEAVETIAYAIPTLDLDGHHLVHFGGFAKHVGFYPVPSAMETFAAELAPYKSGKGSARFPLGRPLPADLITRIVEFRISEVSGEGARP